MTILCINTYIDEQTVVYGVCQIVIQVHPKRFLFLAKVQRHWDGRRYVCARRAETLGLGAIRSPSRVVRKSQVSLHLGGHSTRLRV